MLSGDWSSDVCSSDLNSKGFDEWAAGYDASVRHSHDAGEYPFAGYDAVLSLIEARVNSRPGADVLDLGFGTGMLTARLYAAGHPVARSEERRVGKECRSRWSPYH